MTSIVAKHPVKGLAPYLMQRVRLRLAKGQQGVEAHIRGKSVTLDCRDIEQKYFAADCIKEPENLMVYTALAESGVVDSFVDIGANCGHVASSILPHFKSLVLIEPNPKLMRILRELYDDTAKVRLVECAIVDEASVGELTLKVPVGSSGLASLGATELVKDVGEFEHHVVKATTLEAATVGADLSKAYVKIDVEGFEEKVISSASQLFTRARPIVGFEALSRDAAARCADLFHDCDFFHARFGFMHASGSLRQSAAGIAAACLQGADFVVLEEPDMWRASAQNFSQVFAVPKEKSAAFRNALTSWSGRNPAIDLAKLTSR
jgi:FkbM family methyltransferase